MAVIVEIKVDVVVVVLVATEKLKRKRPERYRLELLVSLFITDGSADRKKLVDEMEGWMKLVFSRSSKLTCLSSLVFSFSSTAL